ncbi:MAG TPA: hypothetical protein VNW92_02370, partial [Polyangiaceae bacterium]|nr:hypothetical protein [Polyangiaceae bacterium]
MRLAATLGLSGALCGVLLGACGGPVPASEVTARVATQRLVASVPWSQSPPDQFLVAEVPQFVAVTFDDNFVSGLGDVKGGMT